MYHIYHTDGLIVGSRPNGEANRSFDIFTRELGLVRATAQGVRHISSKLRYHAEDFSKVKASLVRGREVWRLTGLESLQKIGVGERGACRARVLRLLRRLIHGEEKNAELFSVLENGFSFLEEGNLSGRDLAVFESLLVLRMLRHLGYFDQTLWSEFSDTHTWDAGLLSSLAPRQKDIVITINTALKATQL